VLTIPTSSVVITRQVYDLLVAHEEWYMLTHWNNFEKKWFLEGVRVTGGVSEMIDLAQRIVRVKGLTELVGAVE
jgi:hypothetical protein